MISALDNHLLRAYLDGEMDEAAAEAFEILMIERPELAELVDADTALHLGLAKVPAQVSAATPAQVSAAMPAQAPVATPAQEPATPAGAPVVALPAPSARRPVIAWAPLLAAASIALAVGVVAGRVWAPMPGALVPTTLLSVDRMRSSVNAVPVLRLPAGGQVVLSVPVAADPGCVPRVRIRQGADALEAQVAPDELGFVNLSLAAARLAPGKAEVMVDCGSRPRVVYPVEFVR